MGSKADANQAHRLPVVEKPGTAKLFQTRGQTVD
jgi:hypothetical protein